MNSLDFDFRITSNVDFEEVKKQSRFAFAGALTTTAFDVRKEVQGAIPRWMNITKRFHQQSVVVDKADKRTMTARVGFLERVRLAMLLEKGGTRKPRGTALAVPTRQFLQERRGKITAAWSPRNILRKPGYFSAKIGGTSGIWRRKAATRRRRAVLTLIYAYESHTKHEAGYLRLQEVADKVLKQNLARNFETSLVRALQSKQPKVIK